MRMLKVNEKNTYKSIPTHTRTHSTTIRIQFKIQMQRILNVWRRKKEEESNSTNNASSCCRRRRC